MSEEEKDNLKKNNIEECKDKKQFEYEQEGINEKNEKLTSGNICSICKHPERILIEDLYLQLKNIGKVKSTLLKKHNVRVSWEALNRHFKRCCLSYALMVKSNQDEYLKRIEVNPIANQPLTNKLNFLEQVLFDLVLLIGSKMNLKNTAEISKTSRDIKALSETIVKVVDTQLKVLSLDKSPEEQIGMAQKQMEKTLENVLSNLTPEAAEEVLKALKGKEKEKDSFIMKNSLNEEDNEEDNELQEEIEEVNEVNETEEKNNDEDDIDLNDFDFSDVKHEEIVEINEDIIDLNL